MKTENPFVYGTIVTGKHFVDREKETEEILSDMISGQHVVLYSQRKMGKSSLIEEAFGRMDRKKAVGVRINIERASGVEDLAKLIINEILRSSYTSLDKLRAEIRGFFKNTGVRVFVDSDGKIGIEAVFREKTEVLEDALELPERLGKKKRLVVAFDEFQEIERFDGMQMEKTMRAIMERHRNVTYLFAGSERHLMSLIFEDKERPFYRFGKMMQLGPIPEEDLKEFITGRFKETGRKITNDALRFIIDFSEGIPFYVQAMCHEAWNLGDVDLKTAKIALENIISSLGSGFEIIWRGIRSEYQRKLLVILTMEDGHFEPNTEFIEKYRLKTLAHLRKAMESLEKKGLIYQNRIEDFFFREWIRREKSI